MHRIDSEATPWLCYGGRSRDQAEPASQTAFTDSNQGNAASTSCLRQLTAKHAVQRGEKSQGNCFDKLLFYF